MSEDCKDEEFIESKYPRGLILFVIMIGGFMAILDSSIVNVAIPAMMNAFGVGSDEISWVVTIYMLVLGVIVPQCGWFGDRFGQRKLYIGALGIFTLGSLLCAIGWDVPSLTAFRVVQALGGGMIMPTMMSMVYKITPREKIGSAMGVFGLVMLVAPAIGPSLGGYLVEYIQWRWIFTINIPIGVVGLILAYYVLPEFPEVEAGKYDWWGALTSAVSMFCLLYALTEGEDWGWTSEPIVYLFFTSLVTLILFICHELTTQEPLLDLTLFKDPSFTFGNLVLVILTIGMYGALFYVPLFLQNVKGLGAFEAGLLMLPPALVMGIMMPISGNLYDKIGPRPLVTSGIILLSAATYLFSNIDINTELSTIIAWNTLRSIAIGLTMMPTQTALMSGIPTSKISRASSITNIVSRVSGSFGIAFLTIVISNRQVHHYENLRWNITSNNEILVNGLQEVSGKMMGLVRPDMTMFDSTLGLLAEKVGQISFVQAIDDMFIITSILTIMAFFPAFILKAKK